MALEEGAFELGLEERAGRAQVWGGRRVGGSSLLEGPGGTVVVRGLLSTPS